MLPAKEEGGKKIDIFAYRIFAHVNTDGSHAQPWNWKGGYALWHSIDSNTVTEDKNIWVSSGG